jgi:cobalamin biosynthesis protein CobD/CbiB
MNIKDLLKTVFINVLYIVALIVAVTLVSAIVASIGAIITNNINVIVIACLISVWTTVLVLNILKYYITFRKKTKELNKNNVEEYRKESNKLKM